MILSAVTSNDTAHTFGPKIFFHSRGQMKVINVLYCVLACSMYQNVLSNGYLSILLSHGDIRCISEIFHKGAEVSMNIAAISKSKNIDAQLISFVVSNLLRIFAVRNKRKF